MKNYTILLFLPLIISCSNFSSDQEAQENAPNIVLIISDDQSWTDYSFMGHEHISTPNIDKLAREGLTFTHGYATAPLCSPSLASIITGLYPHQHGILGNDPPFETKVKRYSDEWMVERRAVYQRYIDQFEKLTTIPDLLKEKNYVSLQTGKWWLGNFATGGFDKGMTHGDPKRRGRHGDEGLTIGREGMKEIFSFIDNAQEKKNPFFIWYAPFLPHAPHNPPEDLLQKYLELAPTPAIARYWAMCEWFDVTCGQLMDYVAGKGLANNTLFVYVTDNGWIQDPEISNKYAPRSKREPYEMGIRTPIIFKWSGKIEAEMNTTAAVSAIDIATTLLELINIQPDEKMKGINVLDKKKRESRDLIYAENYSHDFSTIDSSLYHKIAIDLPYKLIISDTINKPKATTELFNIVEDPFEEVDLFNEHHPKVKEIQSKINQWWRID